MKRPLYLLAIPVMLALAACRPGAAEYTATEAPKELRVDSAATAVNLAFSPGSAQLAPGEAARLQRLALSGDISPSDRVTVMTGGDPRLRELRIASISRELLQYGIAPTASSLGAVGRDRVIVSVGRYVVTPPACPDWSQDPASDFTNAKSSNFGCAMATNLGMMVANPADLIGGRELAHADATPAVNAVVRYQTDKVKLPETVSGAAALSPSSGTGGAPAAGAPAPTQ